MWRVAASQAGTVSWMSQVLGHPTFCALSGSSSCWLRAADYCSVPMASPAFSVTLDAAILWRSAAAAEGFGNSFRPGLLHGLRTRRLQLAKAYDQEEL
mmetsp:Transcript_106899/g.307436  ORF Transcript_106899/g.307436 Transcript_106899/m.307436 type:complete len:98 (+) Transcript_106899:118-411(+)